MILLSLVLVLASAGLLIAGLGAGDHHLIWGSMVASLLAAACLAIAVFRRRAPIPVAASPDHSRPENSDSENSRPENSGIENSRPEDAGPGIVLPDRERNDRNTAETTEATAAADSVPAEPATSDSVTSDSVTSDSVTSDSGQPALDPQPAPPADEPAEEQASSTDVLRILDLLDEVMVVDERPRYHLPQCVHLIGKDAQPLPISEARGAGFSPCALCRPDSTLADRARGGA